MFATRKGATWSVDDKLKAMIENDSFPTDNPCALVELCLSSTTGKPYLKVTGCIECLRTLATQSHNFIDMNIGVLVTHTTYPFVKRIVGLKVKLLQYIVKTLTENGIHVSAPPGNFPQGHVPEHPPHQQFECWLVDEAHFQDPTTLW